MYMLRLLSAKVLNSLPFSGAHKETAARGNAVAALRRWLHLLRNNRLLFSSRNSPKFWWADAVLSSRGPQLPQPGACREDGWGWSTPLSLPLPQFLPLPLSSIRLTPLPGCWSYPVSFSSLLSIFSDNFIYPLLLLDRLFFIACFYISVSKNVNWL